MSQQIRIQRKSEVLDQFGICTSTLYNRVQKGLFPPPISLGDRATGWIDQELQAVIIALATGKKGDELKNLVTSLISNRKNLFKVSGCKPD